MKITTVNEASDWLIHILGTVMTETVGKRVIVGIPAVSARINNMHLVCGFQKPFPSSVSALKSIAYTNYLPSWNLFFREFHKSRF